MEAFVENVEQDHDEAMNRKLTGPPNKREEPGDNQARNAIKEETRNGNGE